MDRATSTKYVVACMAIAAVIVVFMSQHNEEAATIVKEGDSALFKVDGGLAETVEDFIAISAPSKPRGASLPPWDGGISPDLSDKFTRFRLVKESALKEASAATFGAASLKCRTLRNRASLKCGVEYCSARKACNNACKKLFGQPKRKIVPLTEGGPKFYHVQEVSVKEVHAKEKRTKEIQAKERAKKEKVTKEKKYKEQCAKEKIAKEKKQKEMKAKEKAKKEKMKKETVAKEKKAKAEEKAFKKKAIIKCDKKASALFAECEKEQAAKAKKKAAADAKAAKARAKSARKELANKKLAKLKAAAGSAEAKAIAATVELKGASGSAKLITAESTAAALVPAGGIGNGNELIAADYSIGHNLALLHVQEDATSAVDKGLTPMMVAKSTKKCQKKYIIKKKKECFKAAKKLKLKIKKVNRTSKKKKGGHKAHPYGCYFEKTTGLVFLNRASRSKANGAKYNDFAICSGPKAKAKKKAKTSAKILTTPPSKKVDADKKKVAADKKAAATATAVAAKKTTAADKANDKASTTKAKSAAETATDKAFAKDMATSKTETEATDSYVSTHRGKLHKISCSERKKYSFDVCFGRAKYKTQLQDTKDAKEARTKAAAYEKKYGIAVKAAAASDKAAAAATKAADKADAKVKVDTLKMDADAGAAIAAVGAVANEKISKKAAGGSGAGSRRLLTIKMWGGKKKSKKKRSKKCIKATDNAYIGCRKMLNLAYSQCEQLFLDIGGKLPKRKAIKRASHVSEAVQKARTGAPSKKALAGRLKESAAKQGQKIAAAKTKKATKAKKGKKKATNNHKKKTTKFTKKKDATSKAKKEA
jgi:hypothetical protein